MAVINTIGRRKTSVARIYLQAGTGAITVNGRDLSVYFPSEILRKDILKPFSLTQTVGQFDVKVNVDGGGVTGQAGAIRMAIARALDEFNSEFHTTLKMESLFTRDPRMVERKKSGRKKARKRFQFSKR